MGMPKDFVDPCKKSKQINKIIREDVAMSQNA